MNNDQIIGVIGNILLVASYLPQIRKIIKTQKAEDISILTWLTIMVGDLLFLVYALMKNDAIITALFTIFTIENLIMLYLSIRYGRKKAIPGEELNPREKPNNSENDKAENQEALSVDTNVENSVENVEDKN